MKEQQQLEDGWFYHNHAWHLLHEFLKLIREVDGAKSLLDVGAGTGLAAAVIRGVFPELNVSCLDVETNCAEFWEKRNLTGFIGNIEKYPTSFGDDIIILSHVLEHIEPYQPIYNFIKNIFITANKRIIIAVPDGPVNCSDHKKVYTRDILEEIIRDALKDEKYTYRGFSVYHPHMNNLVAVIDKW